MFPCIRQKQFLSRWSHHSGGWGRMNMNSKTGWATQPKALSQNKTKLRLAGWSASLVTWYHAWQPEFSPQGTHGRIEQTHTSCLLTQRQMDTDRQWLLRSGISRCSLSFLCRHRVRRNKLEKSLLTQTSTTHLNKRQQALLDLQAHVFGRERSISSFMRVKLYYCIEDSNLGLRSSESKTSVKCLGGGR